MFAVTDSTVFNVAVSTVPGGGRTDLLQACGSFMNRLDKHRREDLLDQRYFTGIMPLLTPNHQRFETHVSPEALASTIYMKCGVGTGSGWQLCYLMKIDLNLLFQMYIYIYI